MTATAATWAVYDHASTGVQAPWGIPDDIIHLDAMALWIGGLAVLAGFALRDAGARDGQGLAAVARAVPRFSSIALGCVVALAASGAYQTWREVGSWNALADTTYGRLVIAKVTGLFFLIELGYLARRLIRRGLSVDALLAERERPSLAAAAGVAAEGAAEVAAGVVQGRRPARSARGAAPAGLSGDGDGRAGEGAVTAPAARQAATAPRPGRPRRRLGADPAAAAPLGRDRARHRRGHPRGHRRAGEHRDRARVLRAAGQRQPGVQHRRGGRRGHRARARRAWPGSGRTRSSCPSPWPAGRRSSRRR